MTRQRLPPLLAAALLAILTACMGPALRPGVDTEAAVLHRMGSPVMEWTHADGSRQLAYPTGPFGVHTWMVRIAPDGRLERIENVLAEEHFARVKPGMSMEDVLQVLGPVDPSGGVTYFERRDELVWEWLYCPDWRRLSRFYVLFDGTTGKVRSTMSLMDLECERFRMGFGGIGGCGCAR